MRRFDLNEIHDHPAFPAFLRDLVTDALQSLWEFGNTYKPVLGHLLGGMERAGVHEVLDLCSGGGGPWLRLVREPELVSGGRIAVRLTDKYPNRGAFVEAGQRSPLLRFESNPVDAVSIPHELPGFRTIFSSFHHFCPSTARRILFDAMEKERGVGIFEMARRSPRTMLTVAVIPFLAVFLAPSIRPFRWSRLFWTWLVPVVPFVLLYDGIVSCLRAYSIEELEELITPLKRPGYGWQIGEERSGFLAVTYLVGYPIGMATK